MSMNLTIEEVAHHRNGVGGAPFSVVKFACPEAGNMIGIVFDLAEGKEWDGRCAVLNRDMLAEGNIAFGENSWRGDHYESDLRVAIEKRSDERFEEFKQRIIAANEAELILLDPREAIMNAWDGESPQPVI